MGDVRRGAEMSMTVPSGAESTKCLPGLGDSISLAATIFTVYAGPQTFTLSASREGENMVMSGGYAAGGSGWRGLCAEGVDTGCGGAMCEEQRD